MNIAKISKFTDTENKLEVSSGEDGERQYRGWGVEGTNYWVFDRLSGLLYNMGNLANVL